MHNTENFDRPVAPGDRVLVRACGIAYVGGNVMKPGAYRFLVGAKLRELEQAVKRATSEDELRSEIARLTRQKLTSP
jgi:protein involved in polysaccharide export with SLBB domain